MKKDRSEETESWIGVELPEWAKDAVFVASGLHFSMRDRVKILLGWSPVYDCGVATEEKPGNTSVYRQRIWFERPSWWPWKPRRIGYEAVESSVTESGS